MLDEQVSVNEHAHRYMIYIKHTPIQFTSNEGTHSQWSKVV